MGFRLARSLPQKDGGPIPLPVRYVDTEIFIQGEGPIGMSQRAVSVIHDVWYLLISNSSLVLHDALFNFISFWFRLNILGLQRMMPDSIFLFSGKSRCLDTEKYQVVWTPSTSKQYEYWESETCLNQSLNDEYGSPEPRCVQLVQIATAWIKELKIPRNRALHLGCATGRATLHLAELVDEVS